MKDNKCSKRNIKRLQIQLSLTCGLELGQKELLELLVWFETTRVNEGTYNANPM